MCGSSCCLPTSLFFSLNFCDTLAPSSGVFLCWDFSAPISATFLRSSLGRVAWGILFSRFVTDARLRICGDANKSSRKSCAVPERRPETDSRARVTPRGSGAGNRSSSEPERRKRRLDRSRGKGATETRRRKKPVRVMGKSGTNGHREPQIRRPMTSEQSTCEPWGLTRERLGTQMQ